FQGHPEYDSISLMKEYKREIGRYINGEIKEYPPFPENYFSLKCQTILEEYQDNLNAALAQNSEIPVFPENYIIPFLDNTWHDTAEAVINNWIGQVYQLTNTDRHIPFNENTDPDNPLTL
ncbi:MAG: homoserine O-acetyltransferase/O-succinyltransferase family protein, partial [Gammaproteobacteria bacterium]